MSTSRLLLVDDDAALLDIMSMALEDAGYEVASAIDGAEALEILNNETISLMVSDINMPRLDGFSLVRRLRDQGHALPVLLLTSRDSDVDEALGLDFGADDFMTKPFSTRVLLARIAALLRRAQAVTSVGCATHEVGDLQLVADRLTVTWKSTSVDLTVTEFRLVEALSSQPGVVLSRPQLMGIIRGDDSRVEARIIDTYVRRVRRKFEAVDASFGAVQTVIGAGYRWLV